MADLILLGWLSQVQKPEKSELDSPEKSKEQQGLGLGLEKVDERDPG